MDTKDIKGIEIVAPEGYEIDSENSTLEKIIFKKKDDKKDDKPRTKPRTWEELCKLGFTGEEAYITFVGVTKSCHRKGDYRDVDAVGYVGNIEEAEAFIALIQLRQLRKAWVGDWEPDWLSSEPKHVINGYKDYICVDKHYNYSKCLSFPTKDMANEFMECFKDLLEKAKILL